MFQKTVLVIDDEPDICANIQVLLETRGFRVVLARNGKEGIDKARAEAPHLILLDVKLPVLSGFEVCRCLKEDPSTKNIPIMMLTAMDTLGDVEKSFTLGADDYLSKPFDTERLIEKVKKYL